MQNNFLLLKTTYFNAKQLSFLKNKFHFSKTNLFLSVALYIIPIRLFFLTKQFTLLKENTLIKIKFILKNKYFSL